MGINREIIDVSVRGAGKAQSSLRKLGGAALKLGGAFFAARGIVRGMSTVINSGSQLKSVEVAFKNMGKEVDKAFSPQALKKFKAATDGTVSSLELMTKANNAMALGIVDSEDQFANLLDTAQRLGKALGQDTPAALDSLVTGMGRQSKLMLDNLGIMVDTEKAYEDYAESIGKTVNELDDSEKKTAFNNAAMSEANRIVEQMGDEQLTTADRISKLKNTFADMASTIGKDADGMFSSVVTAAQGIADKLADALDFAKKIDWPETTKKINENWSIIFGGIGQLSVVWADYIGGQFIGAFGNVLKYMREDFLGDFGETIFTGFANIGIMVFNLIGRGMDWIVKGIMKLSDWIQTAIGGEESKIDWEAIYGDIPDFEDVKIPFIDIDSGNIETFSDAMEETKEIMNGVLNSVVVTNEAIIESDNSVVDNKQRLADKKKEIDDKQREADRANFAEGTANFRTNLEKAGKEYKAFQQLDKAMKIQDILRIIPKTVTSAFDAGMSVGGPFAPVVAAAFAASALAAQMAQLKQIKKAQYGADFVTSGPQMMMVGEAGAEQVSVTPLEGPNIEGPQGQGITLNISGNVLHESFVEDNIIPQIREGLRLGENMGV